MRNGNLLPTFLPNTSFYRSYPTYEEWKLLQHLCSSKRRRTVLILPMRNGNFYKFYSTRIRSLVLILPMRNGNYFLRYLRLVHQVSSYPTYEEWKRNNNIAISIQIYCSSYPTYEEWKPTLSCWLLYRISSYPTYEEWKLF